MGRSCVSWVSVIVVAFVGCNTSAPKRAPRPEPSPAERAALAEVLPGPRVGLPRPLANIQFGMHRDEIRAIAPALVAGEPSVIHETAVPGLADGTIALRFSGGRLHEVTVSIGGKELRSTLTELWGAPVEDRWWLDPDARLRGELAPSSSVTLRPYLPLRELLGSADQLGIEPLVGQPVDAVRARFGEAFREETAAEMAASAERVLRHAPPGIDPAEVLRDGPMRTLFLPPTELDRMDRSTVVDLRVRDGVVVGFTLVLRYDDARERAELARRFEEAWGPTPPVRLRLQEAPDEDLWRIVVGSGG